MIRREILLAVRIEPCHLCKLETTSSVLLLCCGRPAHLNCLQMYWKEIDEQVLQTADFWCPFCTEQELEAARTKRINDSFLAREKRIYDEENPPLLSSNSKPVVPHVIPPNDFWKGSEMEQVRQPANHWGRKCDKKTTSESKDVNIEPVEYKCSTEHMQALGEDTCGICTNEPAVRLLCCGFPTHAKCLTSWYQVSGRDKCPNCRGVSVEPTEEAIYLKEVFRKRTGIYKCPEEGCEATVLNDCCNQDEWRCAEHCTQLCEDFEYDNPDRSHYCHNCGVEQCHYQYEPECSNEACLEHCQLGAMVDCKLHNITATNATRHYFCKNANCPGDSHYLHPLPADAECTNNWCAHCCVMYTPKRYCEFHSEE